VSVESGRDGPTTEEPRTLMRGLSGAALCFLACPFFGGGCYAPTTETRCDGSDMPFAQSDEGVAILDYALDNRPSTGEWAAGWFSQRARSPLVPVGCLRFRAARTQIFHRNHRSHFSQTRWISTILLATWSYRR
jgi:hypothetical protein